MKDYIKLVSLSVVLLIVSCKGETQKEETQPTDTKEVVILPENLGGQFRLESGGQFDRFFPSGIQETLFSLFFQGNSIV